MNKKVYFAGSIRAGRQDVNLYLNLINHIKELGHTVLTEQVGDPKVLEDETRKTDIEIYKTDVKCIEECDLLIAECTTPSLGVGYELCYAEKFNKPVYILYNKDKCQLSAMLSGDEYFIKLPYYNIEEAIDIIEKILK